MNRKKLLFGNEPTLIGIRAALARQNIHFGSQGILYLIKLLQRVGLRTVFPTIDPILQEDERFFDVQRVTKKLKDAAIIEKIIKIARPDDEPHLFHYSAKLTLEKWTSGSSFKSRIDACYAALAESVERYIWFRDKTCAGVPIVASWEKLGASAIDPLRFSGFSKEHRDLRSELTLSHETPLGWIVGYSHTQNSSTLIPAQTVTNAYYEEAHHERREPILLHPITTGLSTATTFEEAAAKGALECIERDAFIIQYLNSLTPPQLDQEHLANQDGDIAQVLASLRRYKLKAHLLYTTTDAPVHVVCCVLVDETGGEPALIPGMRASFNLKTAVLDSIKEALTIRGILRISEAEDYPEDFSKFEMKHRGAYWAKQEHAHQLSFFLSGEQIKKDVTLTPSKVAASTLTWPQQLAILTQWFKAKDYAFVTVDLSSSQYNKANWHIVMALCPELQPMHLFERYAYHGGARLHGVPVYLGKKPATAFNPIPHPFM